jgi:hypothetical protein
VKRGILVFIAADAAASHFFVGAHIVVREVFLAEDNVEAQPQHPEAHKDHRN